MDDALQRARVTLAPTDGAWRSQASRARPWGDVIGYAGWRPIRVGLELWRLDESGQVAIDPRVQMRSWAIHPSTTAPDASARTSAA